MRLATAWLCPIRHFTPWARRKGAEFIIACIYPCFMGGKCTRSLLEQVWAVGAHYCPGRLWLGFLLVAERLQLMVYKTESFLP